MKTPRHLKLDMYDIISFIAETIASVYDNYREFEISVLPLSHLKLKGLGQ